MTNDNDILTLAEAAAYIGIAPRTLRKWLQTKSIPGRKIGRIWRFSKRQLREWIESGKEKK